MGKKAEILLIASIFVITVLSLKAAYSQPTGSFESEVFNVMNMSAILCTNCQPNENAWTVNISGVVTNVDDVTREDIENQCRIIR